MAMIMFMGKVSGAHFNPVVSIAFALRQDFPWIRVPGYIVAQAAGGVLAVLFLQAVVGVSAAQGGTYPATTTTHVAAFWMEAVLTFGLLSVILGTASGAQNIGIIGALGVGGYIALAGLWASPLSGASMNPVRSLAPDLVSGDYAAYWVYLAGPLLGAVGCRVLRLGSARSRGRHVRVGGRPGRPAHGHRRPGQGLMRRRAAVLDLVLRRVRQQPGHRRVVVVGHRGREGPEALVAGDRGDRRHRFARGSADAVRHDSTPAGPRGRGPCSAEP